MAESVGNPSQLPQQRRGNRSGKPHEWTYPIRIEAQGMAL